MPTMRIEVVEQFDSSGKTKLDETKLDEEKLDGLELEETKWKDLPVKQKLGHIFHGLKILMQILTLIYFFMCGIDVLTTSFKLVGGKNINSLTQAGTLKNPLVGLIVGVLVTILVQSSSTSTAIIVSLVSSGVIDISQAIPVVMGSNVGTSVTNSFVSFTQVGDRRAFERAFAGATVHDMFNFLCVGALLSIEIITRSIPGSRGFLEYTTELAVNATFNEDRVRTDESPGLKGIISPLTNLIIRINKRIIECWVRNESQAVDTMIERNCNPPTNSQPPSPNPSLISSGLIGADECPVANPNGTYSCCFFFANSDLSDRTIGIILLICSLCVLILCLVTLVKVLNSILKGHVQGIVKKYVNSDLSCAPYLTGYIALIIGAIMTIIMQSSSIFTSLLTPLIGMDVVSIERCYPLTLGSNLGTTTTALLAAFTEGSKDSIQIALVHLFFNLFGILMFYPIPFTRIPIGLAKGLGKITAKYRWFAIVYILSTFVLLPCFLLSVSQAGPIAFWTTLGIAFFLIALISIVKVMQKRAPSALPPFMRTWDFVPRPLRSLEPYDSIFTTVLRCCKKPEPEEGVEGDSELPQIVMRPISVASLDSGIDNLREVENQNV